MFLGRAKRKMDELQRLLETAKMNYQQLGGELEEDKIKQEERKESARLVMHLNDFKKALVSNA
jgi:uncharacterized protein involved in exopolysaccharide biosynthesis